MRYSLINKIIIISFVFAVSGCAGIMANMPVPLDSMVKVKLLDPYDEDIPKIFVNQLKWASVTSDWAVPYIFINVGSYFESIGDEQKALHYFGRAISELSKRQDVNGEGTAISRKILTLCKFGKIQEAYNAIKELEKAWSTEPLNSFVFYNYGHYYLMNGNYNKALEYFRQSLESNKNFQDNFNLIILRRNSELEYGIALILIDYFRIVLNKYNLSDFSEEQYKTIQKNIDEGIFHLNQVAVLNREIKKTKIDRFTPNIFFHTIEANAYNYLGLAYGIKKQFPEAKRALDAAGKLARKANYREGEINSILLASQICLLDKNIAAAEQSALRLSEIADKYHLNFYKMWAQFILSMCYQEYGNASKALDSLKAAIAIMEVQHPELIMELFKETYTFRPQIFYDKLIELLIKEGDNKGALETAERAKEKILVDLLAGKDIGKSSQEAELLSQLKNCKNEMADSLRKILLVDDDDDLALKKTLDKIKKAEQSYNDVIGKIKAQNEELNSIITVEEFDAENVRKLLDQNTTLFSYYITSKTLYIWAINKDRVHLEKVKITKEEAAQMVFSFNSAIAAKNYDKTESLSEKVYNMFLKPVIPFVTGDHIGIIPHGSLYYLPFAAMSYKGQYLVDAFSIFYLPSAGVLKYVLKKQPAEGLNMLAFINPDSKDKKLELPYFVTEVDSIRNIFPQANIILKGEATKAKVTSIASSYDVLHFATNCVFVEDAPLKSGILLTPGVKDDGRLTTDEIFKLHFKGRAIIMSACRTNPVPSSTGAEVAGLNRAFLYAGSPSVISTLWNIEDKSKAVFMDLFYINLGKNESIADSLRITQNEMIRLGYPPFEWAAFILTGKN